MINLPLHLDPINDDLTGCAPYTFVPLPNCVVPVVLDAEELPRQDTFHNPDYPHCGYFDVDLTTLSPLYVRCALTRQEFDRQEREEDKRKFQVASAAHLQGGDQEPMIAGGAEPFRQLLAHKPGFFSTESAGKPVIPASTLRGMLRALVAIASYGKVQPVTTARLRHRPGVNYVKSPRDLIDQGLIKETDIDYPEALFGYVKSSSVGQPQGHPARGYAGRVQLSSATFVSKTGESLWLVDPAYPALVPKILSEPKPRHVGHYLVQPNGGAGPLLHYDSPPGKTTIRGSKRYWHQGERSAEQLQYGDPPPFSTQHTQIRPVAAKVTFHFRVYFDNLSAKELGALCWALHPVTVPGGPEGVELAHSVGMGKPLGMGAVRLRAKLHRIDRGVRYGRLFQGGAWNKGDTTPPEELADRDSLKRLTQEFENDVVSLVAPGSGFTRLHELERIQALLTSMSWPGIAPRPPEAPLGRNRRGNTRYMLRQEFGQTTILPSPLGVLQSAQAAQLVTSAGQDKDETGVRPILTEAAAEALKRRFDQPAPTVGQPDSAAESRGPKRGDILPAAFLHNANPRVAVVELLGEDRGEIVKACISSADRDKLPPKGEAVHVRVADVDASGIVKAAAVIFHDP